MADNVTVSVIDAITAAFCHDIVELDGLLLLSAAKVRRPQSATAISDAVGVESTLNKRYMTDLVGRCIQEENRDKLMAWGRAIIRVWSERIALRFPEREVAFYLGGSESTILRFHVRRPGSSDWTNLEDREFLSTSRIEVYVLRGNDLEMI